MPIAFRTFGWPASFAITSISAHKTRSARFYRTSGDEFCLLLLLHHLPLMKSFSFVCSSFATYDSAEAKRNDCLRSPGAAQGCSRTRWERAFRALCVHPYLQNDRFPAPYSIKRETKVAYEQTKCSPLLRGNAKFFIC